MDQKYQDKDYQITQGIIHVHYKGFAFVSPDDAANFPKDVFIPKHLKGNAIDGDHVEIAVDLKRKSAKGPEGHVVKVIQRGKTQLVGIVWFINPKGNYVLYIQSLGNTKTALLKKTEKEQFQIGDRLLLNILDWGDENAPALCEVIEKMGSINNPETDIPCAIKDFNIREDFPSEAIKEAKKFPSKVVKKDLIDRLDLTHLETVTIDPTTAKDFDDALSLTQDEKGIYHLWVHIADVSHYVRSESFLDQEAMKRCNSTYFPNRCVPMLPESLSNQLCSLKEKVIRLTLTVEMKIDEEGNLIAYGIHRSYIKSRKRLTYEGAKKILDGKMRSPHYPLLKLMEQLCLLLKKKRFERGSVDLSLPEIVLLIDEKGQPYSYKVIEYDITHQLVEEFMLKANEVVAKHFSSKNLPSVFRIHESPSRESLEDFYSLARALGFSLPDKVESKDIQKLFETAKSTLFAEQLSIAFIRSMKLAIYSNENVGHFGLALEDYCHFTSPIRRYSDLIVHRLLFDTKIPLDLDRISKECSEKERISFKAEMSVINLKKLRLLKEYQKEDPKRIYSSVITKVKPFGFYFSVDPIQLEGFIHVSELEDDYYEFYPERRALRGQNRHKSYTTGDKVNVIIKEVNLIQLETSWILIQEKKQQKRKRRKR